MVSKSGQTIPFVGFIKQYSMTELGKNPSTHCFVGNMSSHMIRPLANILSKINSGLIESNRYGDSGIFIQFATAL